MTVEYDDVPGWGEETWDEDVTGIAVDSQDRVYALRRGHDAVTVLGPEGMVIDRWGDERFSARPHLISIDHEDRIYIADDGGHRVYVFDSEGHPLETIGTGTPSKTAPGESGSPDTKTALDRMRGGPPFNRPTKAVATPTGEVFVSDGYRNCRVHRFSADRRSVHSWGGPGADAGCFVIPHSVTIDPQGRVAVCDRENDRIQIFSTDGDLLETWDDVQRPTDLAFDGRGYAYVTELARGPIDLKSWRLGPAKQELPGRVTILSPDHVVVARIGPPAVGFLAPHAVAVDSAGAIYVSEVPKSFASSTGRELIPHRCLHKFMPRGTSLAASQIRGK